jgi:hypothetical protein
MAPVNFRQLLDVFYEALTDAVHLTTLSHKRCNFVVTKDKTCFDFLYNSCLKHFSFKVEFSEITSKKSKRLHVKYPLFLSDFNKT